jgi:hypothetical protein
MHFRLTYRGELRANGAPLHKHAIRKTLHKQLAALWEQKPLVTVNNPVPPIPNVAPNTFRDSLLKTIGGFSFIPLVCEQLRLVCKLDIVMLRPEEPGNLITAGGDIDNRLKTLFDALRYPRNANEMPVGVLPDVDENPFHCLLEDDNLITGLSVTTDRLLQPAGPNAVELLIAVQINPTVMTHGNGFLIG